jgi:hypothetical protein
MPDQRRIEAMQYVLQIYDDEAVFADLPAAEREADFGAWSAYSAELGQSGKLRSGEALHPVATATTIRAASDGPIVADGPFAETKEHLGGSFVIDAADLDEAIAWAAKMPHIPRGGTVEIRPVMVFGGQWAVGGVGDGTRSSRALLVADGPRRRSGGRLHPRPRPGGERRRAGSPQGSADGGPSRAHRRPPPTAT